MNIYSFLFALGFPCVTLGALLESPHVSPSSKMTTEMTTEMTADTLRPPVTITHFIERWEINGGAGLVIQRNDSLYQQITVDLKGNGGAVIVISEYMNKDEALKLIIESAITEFNQKDKDKPKDK